MSVTAREAVRAPIRGGGRTSSVGPPARAALLVLAAVASSGCTGASSPAATSVTDSAGVRLVTNVRGSIEAAEAWSLPVEPDVEIGAGASPEVPLHRVTAIVPLDGGRVAVGTNTPPRAVVFEPDGALASTLGGPGEGPGEFTTVASVVRLGGDSLAVWDDSRRRMSVFTEDGRFVREADLSGLALPTPLASANTRTPAAWTRLLPSTAGSLVLFQVGIWGESEPGARRIEVPSYRIAVDGGELARFGPFPGEELYDLGAGRGGTYLYPLGADTYAAAAGDALVVGTAEAPEIRSYAADGSLERIVRWPDHDRTVGGELLAVWLDTRQAWFASMSAGQRAVVGDFLERMPLPERFPAYDGIITGEGGGIWVGEYAGRLEMIYPPFDVRVPARRWLVFDVDGALTATVRTPEGFQPYTVREDRVWGVFTDTLDVESVRAYEVVRR